MSQKRMAISLTILELQRQKWTGGILPPAAGMRVNFVVYFCNGMGSESSKEQSLKLLKIKIKIALYHAQYKPIAFVDIAADCS